MIELYSARSVVFGEWAGFSILASATKIYVNFSHSVTTNALIAGNSNTPAVPIHPGKPPEQLSPLPSDEREAKAIASTLNTQALLGANATEKEVRSQLSDARWIHFATHGLLDYGATKGTMKIPGAIALTPSPRHQKSTDFTITNTETLQTDGLLTSDEIINLQLNAELVVLSACDTGRGELTGDGVLGLARAWMGAGVPSVVVSLWAVDDNSTALLMTEFYQNLDQGMEKAQALRQAMLTTAEQYPRPRDWAAFALVGQTD